MPITNSIEIDCPPEKVFDYLAELDKHNEWQTAVKRIEVETPGPTGVGSRAREVRDGPGGEQTVTYEVTEFERPTSAAFRGIDGAIRPLGRFVLTPLDGGTRTRYDFEFDFETHGMSGKMFGKIARRQADKEIPQDLARLKAKLES